MLARSLLLVVLVCFFADCFETKSYRHSYIYHNSGVDEDHGFHLSKSYPRHRMKKQMITPEGHTANPSKRGFLANLATLLNDAESLSKKNSAVNNISLAESAIPVVRSSQNEPASVRSLKEKPEGKNEPTPSAGSVENSLRIEGKDTAPIFALFHGKIVPLGKLPDTSFKKSHTEARLKEDGAEPEHHNNNEIHENNHESSEAKSVIKAPQSSSEIKSQLTPVKKDNSKPLSPSQFSRLSSYFHNLESKTKPVLETRMIKRPVKDVTATAKDEVPDIMPALKNADFIRHVKGIVLDDGKMVPLKGSQQVEDTEKEKEKVEEEATTKSSDAKTSDAEEAGETGKSYAIDNNLLSQLTKSKEETSDPVARDTQSVSLSIETLKGLLKKKDNGVSLAKLLNKQPQESTVATQEEDPGTIEDFAAGGLKKTNDYRAVHHAPPLVWSDDLAAEAQKMAEHLADLKSLQISEDLEKKGYGENVAKVWANFKTAGEAATTMWYKQSSNYRFEDPRLDQNTGQFAQVVWKDSKELGMGVAKSIDDINNKYVYVVSLYRPPGNIETALRDNVLRTGNDTADVYATFFKRSNSIKHSGVLLPKHNSDQK